MFIYDIRLIRFFFSFLFGIQWCAGCCIYEYSVNLEKPVSLCIQTGVSSSLSLRNHNNLEFDTKKRRNSFFDICLPIAALGGRTIRTGLKLEIKTVQNQMCMKKKKKREMLYKTDSKWGHLTLYSFLLSRESVREFAGRCYVCKETNKTKRQRNFCFFFFIFSFLTRLKQNRTPLSYV